MSRSPSEVADFMRANPDACLAELYSEYYEYLVKSVYRMVPDQSTAEDLVQEVFFEIWKKRERLEFRTSVGAYLRRAVTNRALNYIRAKKMNFEGEDAAIQLKSNEINSVKKLEIDDLQQLINDSIDLLPEKCRAVFAMSRFEEMKYAEIAESLGISIKTVENHISKALKLLKARVSPHLEDYSNYN